MNMHTMHFLWLKENNLPEPDVGYDKKGLFREIALGFERVEIEKEDRPGMHLFMRDELPKAKEVREKIRKLRIVDEGHYRALDQKNLAEKYPPVRTMFIKFVDYFITIGDDRVWVIEGKEKLNYEAIGQVLTYKDLCAEDHPNFSEIKAGIVCSESDPILEDTCKKLRIEVFVRKKK